MVVSVFLQAKSESKKCRAKKMVEFQAFPRVGEFVEFSNAYASFPAFVVTEVTHTEGDAPGIRVWPSDTEGKREIIGDDDLEAVVEWLKEESWQVL